MEIKINVLLDVTPRLESLAQTALAALLSRPENTVRPSSTEVGQLKAETTLEGQLPEPQPEPETVQPEVPVEVQQPEVPVQPQPEPPGAETAIPDDETMRTMMDIAISKVCGTNDWKESQDSRVIALRRSCTGCFKEISRRLGAEKPTALQGEGRNRFLAELDNIYVDAGQCKAVWQAF